MKLKRKNDHRQATTEIASGVVRQSVGATSDELRIYLYALDNPDTKYHISMTLHEAQELYDRIGSILLARSPEMRLASD